jgi:hypothetical protein
MLLKPHLFTWLVAAALVAAVTGCFGTTMAHSFSGRVVDAAGTPVAEVSISIVDGPGSFPDLASLSGADGRFVLHDLQLGTYTLRLMGPNGQSAEHKVTVTADAGESELQL